VPAYFNPDKSTAGHKIDCSWHLCPVPILMTEEKLGTLKKGETLEVVYTDPGAKPDLQAWCRANGHELLRFEESKMKNSAFIRKA
jgi:tRNA 2-thiouridine synthesizing protein A